MDLLCGRCHEKMRKSRGKAVKILGICRGKKWEGNQKAMQRCNARLAERLWDLQQVMPAPWQPASLLDFIEEEIAQVYQGLWLFADGGKDLFAAAGFQREALYAAWLQSRVLARFLQPAFAALLEIAPEEMVLLSQKNWFTEQPAVIGAAFAFLAMDGTKESPGPFLLEVQPGFDGQAMIDAQSVQRAKNLWQAEGVYTLRAVLNMAEKTITLLPLPALSLSDKRGKIDRETTDRETINEEMIAEKEEACSLPITEGKEQGFVWHFTQAPPAAAQWLASLGKTQE